MNITSYTRDIRFPFPLEPFDSSRCRRQKTIAAISLLQINESSEQVIATIQHSLRG
jgi:hypothetical protein